jgi:hypothetical protein
MFYVRLGERQENLRGEPLTFSLNILQIKPLYFNCLTKRQKSKTPILGKRICEPFVFFIKTIKYIINITYTF